MQIASIFFAYSFAIISLILCWSNLSKNYIFILLSTSILLALGSNLISILGVIFLLLTFSLIWLSRSHNKKPWNLVVLFFTSVILFLNFQHVLPGFNNICIFKNILISKNAIPFTLYLNYNSVVLATLLILLTKDITLSRSLAELKTAIKLGLLYGLFAIAILLPISYFFKFMEFDFKLSSYTIIFIFVNLIFTCIPEEIFWRGYIQKNIQTYSNKTFALLLTSLIFAAIHLAFGGIFFAILAFIASLIYGVAYIRTKRIEVSIICHYLVNVGQFIFFTYPILLSAYPK